MAKIAVYAIAKNESEHVDRWYESVLDADHIFVLDTGSTDNTIQMLEACNDRDGANVTVFEADFQPFRFDTARNFILNQIPDDYDMAVFLDLDETLEIGWRQVMLDIICDSPIDAIHGRLIYATDAEGNTLISYDRLMATRPGTHKWQYPVHEVLVPIQKVREKRSDIEIYHLPDVSKPRDYLSLLYVNASENPSDPRAAQYLARGLMENERHQEAVYELQRHLTLESNPAFRSESYRFLALCHEVLDDLLEARDCYISACAEAPFMREPWAEASTFFYRQERYYSAIGMIENMMDVVEAPTGVIRNDSYYYGSWPQHMLATCYYRLGNTDQAQHFIQLAASITPNDPAVIRDLLAITDIPIK